MFYEKISRLCLLCDIFIKKTAIFKTGNGESGNPGIGESENPGIGESRTDKTGILVWWPRAASNFFS